MVDEWYRLRVRLFEYPGLLDPRWLEVGVETLQRWHGGCAELLVCHREVRVGDWQIVAAVDQVLTPKMLARHEIGMLAQRQERKARAFGQVVPVKALAAELAVQRRNHDDSPQRLQVGQFAQ